MNNITIKSSSKINLFLSIGKRLPNGYHKISSVFSEINVSDILNMKKIIKKIPIGAGLGGGSGNAAAAIKGLNRLFNLGLNKNKMKKIASEIGSDVPFFIEGGACIVSGIGEKVKKIKSKAKLNLLVIKPKTGISTNWAYNKLDKCNKKGKNSNQKKKQYNLIKALKSGNIKKISENMHNDFEPIIERKSPIIKKIKSDLVKSGALNSMLTGSGSAVFGIFKDKKAASSAYKSLKRKHKTIFLTKTL